MDSRVTGKYRAEIKLLMQRYDLMSSEMLNPTSFDILVVTKLLLKMPLQISLFQSCS